MQVVSFRNKDLFGSYTKDHILLSGRKLVDLLTFLVYAWRLWKTKIKGGRLITLVEEISKELKIQDVFCILLAAF